MNEQEWQRLGRDLQANPALGESLRAGLREASRPDQVAALLRRHGYAVEATDLPEASAPLPEAALDGVAGGGLFDILSAVASKAIPFIRG